MTPELRRVCWCPSWRLVSSRFPPVDLFDRVTRDEDLEIILEIEGLTNDRLRDEIGDIHLVPEADRIHGPGTTPIMAAFTHINPTGSRFSDGTYGVYYAADSLETAVAETAFHRARFLAATREPPLEIDMRSYASDIDAELHDIADCQDRLPELYDPDPTRYAAAQRFARSLRDAGSNGIVYSSVRGPGGECVAVFRPKVLQPAVQGPHLCYVWDGERISNVYRKSDFP
ncbi:hypothetical protein TspCOW1_24920 [Thiohalobacter sp. COW1]|uniref:RES domain-containing protein n=1 Tax=Thiohalobacter thiocyanaticus TaxID=585455 RepID=A0A1Z4VMB7_9GAMM|nr:MULTISPECIES: RES family NAD+ phosphorylase [Thiohalobacter]BAZ92653.1 uncharacterized protein FOKN1_0249 [Thiohalobacter thiocyanaticus]BCO32389.1 hypothetical protein TspCOW1_24920 [Thiohalobacter sp. COW1]